MKKQQVIHILSRLNINWTSAKWGHLNPRTHKLALVELLVRFNGHFTASKLEAVNLEALLHPHNGCTVFMLIKDSFLCEDYNSLLKAAMQRTDN